LAQPIGRIFTALLVWATGALIAFSAQGSDADEWLEVVRSTPYGESQGVAENLQTIRRWVLFRQGYCQPGRHILLDKRWRFLGFIENAESPTATLARLNETRQRFARDGRVDAWAPGASDSAGYPFALACDQPFADMDEAFARLTGSDPRYRVWGTWDGMVVGSEARPVSLIELFQTVFNMRRQQGLIHFPGSVIPTFLGKVAIESGGQKAAVSRDNAQGILQLLPAVLDDCGIPQRHRLHRIAQVDCAIRLMEQNHRSLQPPFNAVFGALPAQKRALLYDLLLTQAHQIGIGRTIQLLQDAEMGEAARYFAANQSRFSAEDMLVGIIFHNLGRRDIGLMSLYYVTDARLVQARLCTTGFAPLAAWCPGRQQGRPPAAARP
jgi:hypothetical protein